MKYQEYFRQRINVSGTPELTQEQFLKLMELFKLESQIYLLDHLPTDMQISVSPKKLELVKKLNKITYRKEPNNLFSRIKFK